MSTKAPTCFDRPKPHSLIEGFCHHLLSMTVLRTQHQCYWLHFDSLADWFNSTKWHLRICLSVRLLFLALQRCHWLVRKSPFILLFFYCNWFLFCNRQPTNWGSICSPRSKPLWRTPNFAACTRSDLQIVALVSRATVCKLCAAEQSWQWPAEVHVEWDRPSSNHWLKNKWSQGPLHHWSTLWMGTVCLKE